MKTVIQFALLAFLSVLQHGQLMRDGNNTTTMSNNIAENSVTPTNNVESSLKTLLRFMPQLRDELQSLRKDFTSLNSSVNSKIDDLYSKTDTLASKMERLGSRMQASQENHTEQINAKLDTLDSKMETLDSRIASQANYTEQINALNSKLDKLDSKMETLDSRIASQENHTEQINAKLDTLDSKMETLDSKMETLDSRIASQANHTEQINTKLDTLTATTAQLSTEHQNLQTNISDIECTDSEESLEVYRILQNNLTHLLEDIQSDVNNIHGPYTCGGTGGWRRVVYLDMTDSSTTCPSGWQLTGYSERTCGRVIIGWRTCNSATFPVSGGEYTRVCGRIKAYQKGSTEGFLAYHNGDKTTIDGAYVSGVSVTHGNPQQHIWTFASGAAEDNPTAPWVCPCDASRDNVIRVPPFVGEDYFCESGINGNWYSIGGWGLYSSDTLWDGEDCLPSSRCCSHRNPPYFIKQLPTPTSDDIEARICLYEYQNVDIAVALVELYVQ